MYDIKIEYVKDIEEYQKDPYRVLYSKTTMGLLIEKRNITKEALEEVRMTYPAGTTVEDKYLGGGLYRITKTTLYHKTTVH